jgi:hypothetical protein
MKVKRDRKMKKVLFALGIILALIGAALMIEGSILGKEQYLLQFF